MARYTVESSAIAILDYDEDTADLLVIFQDGSSYIYPSFPNRMLQQWLNAGSIGGYYNTRVRSRFGGPEDFPVG